MKGLFGARGYPRWLDAYIGVGSASGRPQTTKVHLGVPSSKTPQSGFEPVPSRLRDMAANHCTMGGQLEIETIKYV